MNANAEFLNYVYQNSQMGVDTLEQLLDITEDEKLQAYLKKQLLQIPQRSPRPAEPERIR